MKMWTDRQMDRQTDKKRTNEQMELHQFRKEPSYDGDLSPESKMWADRQTDVGHINLIGGSVTHNPPKIRDQQLLRMRHCR